MRKAVLPVAAVTVICLGAPSFATADPVTPSEAVDSTLFGTTATKTVGGREIGSLSEVATASEGAPSNVIIQSRIVCAEGADVGLCRNPQYCAAPPGSIRHTIFRSEDDGTTFTEIGQACLLPGEVPEAAPPQVTPDLVAQAFADLSWPESPLTVQPPGGRTLVNLETNFLTTNTAATTQSVQLLGQQVDIEATPTSWTWHHGDGTSQSTDQPGTAYPDLTITHIYRDADTTAAVSVDTTYAGRFRVNAGPWQAIPTTRTITGTPSDLEIVPATPQLVAVP